MLAKRVIPCLDVKDGRVVKGRKFQGLQDVADPVALARFYNTSGADELVFYDITASHEGRKLFAETLTGGGINDLSDFDRVLKCGADKVSVNSGAVADPTLVGRAAKRYGDQCVVLSIDAKRAGGRFEVYTKGGRVPTGIDAVEWAKRGEAEEIVLNSIDTDGVKRGFDIGMLRAVCSAVRIPVIASGGAGCAEDFVTLFDEVEGVDAGLAASIFHYGEVDIRSLISKQGDKLCSALTT